MTAEPDPQTCPPLPVTIVSGYLGAGKTTLVNAILAGDHGLRIAVLVNDFGKVAVDEALILNRSGDVVALSNGCMCCQVGGDLYDAIDRILRMRKRFDHLLIETSGVADPAKVAQIAIAEPDLEPACTAVLVDAANFLDVVNDPRLNDTLLRQVRAADRILLTKTGAVASALDELSITLAKAGGTAPIAVIEKGDREAWHLLEARERHARLPTPGLSRFHALPYESWSWTGAEKVHLGELIAFANDPGLKIYRLKGRVRLKDGRSILIHKVGAVITVEAASEILDKSEVVAIGVKPDFDPTHAEAAWAHAVTLREPAPDPTSAP
ncbi:MAG TPA: GTP-binding protein [Rhizobiaceae bacterium]|nr:GTP-binding protein [Rhizobiaceae bacterium]